MRVKKQKRHRKVACLGFRDPLRRHLHPPSSSRAPPLPPNSCRRRPPLHHQVPRPSPYSKSLEASQQLVATSCDHERRVSATACTFFVATQDADIRKKFRQVPGVPVIYGRRNSLFIEQPSALQWGKVLGEAQLMRKTNTAKRMLGVSDKSKFKRKKAKGPNPLSCVKKKKDDSSVRQNEDGQAGGAQKRKRFRKRKRTCEDG